MAGDQIQLPFRNFDIVAEHAVIADAQVPDAGCFFFARLNGGEHAGAAVLNFAELIELLVCAGANHTALAQNKRRLVDNRLFNERFQILQGIELRINFLQQGRRQRMQPVVNRRKRRRALRQTDQIPAVCRAGDDARHDALVVRHLAQRKPQFLAVDRFVDQLLRGGKPPPDFRGAEKRSLHPRAKQPPAHGSFRLVENAEQTPFFLLRAHRLGQLEVAPGGQIQPHELARDVKIQRADVRQFVFLRVSQRAQKRARGNDDLVVPGKPQRVLRFFKLRLNCRLAKTQIELVLPASSHAAAEPVGRDAADFPNIFLVPAEQQLRGAEAAQLVADGFLRVTTFKIRGAERACGNIAERRAVAVFACIDAGVVVVFRLVEHRAFGHGAGGHDADDVALDKTLCQRRVFHLLADGDLVALLDEAGNIALGGMERHAAHGHLVFGRFVLGVVAAGECEIQLPGCNARVLVEHLIEIAQTEKENAVGVPLLDSAVLLHHGRKLSHESTSGFVWNQWMMVCGKMVSRRPRRRGSMWCSR